MQELVTIVNNELFTDTLAIAHGVNRPHHGVIQLARQYQVDLEEFGRVAFKMRPFETAGGQQERAIAMLNERQATLLLSYMRNTDIIRKFKITLVKAFFAMAEELEAARSDNPVGVAWKIYQEMSQEEKQTVQLPEEYMPLVQRSLRKAQKDGATAMAGLMLSLKRAGLPDDFLEKLITFRCQGLSQRNTAKLLDVSSSAIQRWEKKAWKSGLIEKSRNGKEVWQ